MDIEIEDCSVFWSPPPTPPPTPPPAYIYRSPWIFALRRGMEKVRPIRQYTLEDLIRLEEKIKWLQEDLHEERLLRERIERERQQWLDELTDRLDDEDEEEEEEEPKIFWERLLGLYIQLRLLEERDRERRRLIEEEEQEEEEEPKISKFYSIPGTCRSKDPQNRIRKNLHNLMYFYSTFPIMITFMDNIFEDDSEEDSDFEEEIEDCSVFWSPPPTPPPFELPGNARHIAHYHGIALEELEAMRPDEIRQLHREYREGLVEDLTRCLDRRRAIEEGIARLKADLEEYRNRYDAQEEQEEEEEPKEKFYSIRGYCGSKDPQNRIRKNLHNLMYFYSTFPIMM
ncbi:hypothetical protein CAEBREN_24868 [Caenorhabditis brenneri]|uniref:Uncharacterized protein n=1 Tax=Caenorhabditis brenneri TaxID=135651 RepID=G0PDP6_CAEBE|nr:hypothetical protein CAEBREN_24868 [Caenorhabditis brenneri]